MSLCDEYREVLANLSPKAPLALDPLIFDATDRAKPAASADPGLPPSHRLWSLSENRLSCIGVRLREPTRNAHVIAGRLAAIAVERQIIPIFLSCINAADFQRFGFRIEYVSGCNEAEWEKSEEQIRRFWNLAMIIDAKDIARLG